MARPAQGPVATTVWACLAVAFACGLAGCAVHMEVLRDDPGEMINLAVEARHDETLQAQRARLRSWCEQTGDEAGARLIP